MPTVLKVGGFSVRVYAPPHEHGPPHVHVVRAGAEVIIMLGDREHKPTVRRRRGMSRPDVAQAFRIVVEHQRLLRRRWEEIHG